MGFASLWVIPIALVSIVGSRWPSGTLRSWLLLATSVVFYAALEPAALPLVCAVVIATWMGGLVLQRWRSTGVLAALVAASLWPLSLSKYVPWVWQVLSGGSVWFEGGLDERGVPPGLSFVTLQAIGYLVDVYRHRIPPSTALREHAVFLTFFPQLVAGPIERTEDLRPQLGRRNCPSAGEYYQALKLLAWGYAAKFVLADTLAPPIERLLRLPSEAAPAGLLLALPLFSARLYLDFFAYSCIAVALGRMHGIQLTMNFANPYGARSLRDFWRRWHISLSTWFRDYVYIPLGGRRRGASMQVAAVLAVFLLSGLWHGAGFGFLLWGMCHAVGLLVEAAGRHLGTRIPLSLPAIHRAVTQPVRTTLTVAFVTACWLPFLGTPEQPTTVLLLRLKAAVRDWSVTASNLAVLLPAEGWAVTVAAVGVACAHRMEWWYWRRSLERRFAIASDVVLTDVLLVSLLLFADFGGRTFIYFAF